MPLPPPPSRAQQEAWVVSERMPKAYKWWAGFARAGPKLKGQQVHEWIANDAPKLTDAERARIVNGFIDWWTAGIVATGLPNGEMLVAYELIGWKPNRQGYRTCDCIMWHLREKEPAVRVPPEWLQTEKTCSVHAAHAGKDLWRAVQTENHRDDVCRVVIREHFGIEPGGELPPSVVVFFDGASGVDGRPVAVDGLTGQDATDVRAKLDLEYGPGVVDVR